MATQSFLKNISIREKKSARDLINALESGDKKTSKEVCYSKKIRKIEKKDIVGLWKKS